MVTKELLDEVGSDILINSAGKQTVDRRLREGGLSAAHKYLLGLIQYGYKMNRFEIHDAEAYYAKLEASPEQVAELKATTRSS